MMIGKFTTDIKWAKTLIYCLIVELLTATLPTTQPTEKMC